ncbi:MAG: methylenetetrahydrofolate reductase [Nitrospirae bacterium]|nr:methylenetetrahydrofolate reductase [Magnetococcales bacterium]HAT51015.1 5,10-methylenetetrahydrofolate reductase [Alphaproteobacteria bacterium]
MISLELVPRDSVSLIEELELLRGNFREVDLINIPDLPRFAMRSWEGCALARRYFSQVVPHIRARDIDPDRPLPMAGFLREHGIDQVLVVTGDVHPDVFFPQYTVRAVEVIRKFKREMPEVKVYAAMDPYRSGFQEEIAYVREKLNAGAEGIFTQPFFDLRLMEVYGELMKGLNVYWGVSPVTTVQSKGYWEKRNLAVFPSAFEPTEGWNLAFAHAAMAFAKCRGHHVYFMPINRDLKSYLDGLFPR